MTQVTNQLRYLLYKSPRLVTYSGKYNTIGEHPQTGWIDKIQIDDELIYPRTIVANNKVFRYNKIYVESFSSFHKMIGLSLYYTLLSKTSRFLLPALFETDEASAGKKAFLYDTNFVNAYLSIDGSPLDGTIFLLYRYDGSQQMNKLEDWFKSSDIYVEAIQPDKYHTIYQLEVKDKKTYDIFVSSKFADFSKEHKYKLERFHDLKNTDVDYKIIHNSKDYRKKLEELYLVTIPDNVSLNEAIVIEEQTYHTTEMEVIKPQEIL